MTVLLWGLPRDATMASVRRALDRLGTPSVFLDQRLVLSTTAHLELVGGNDFGLDAWVEVGGRRTDLAGVTAAYLRPHDSTQVTAVRGEPPGWPRWEHARAVEECLTTWAELTRAFVVSRPSSGAGNGSKPAQLRAVAACGFAVPSTLVTNDPAAVAAFLERHGTVVYKSTSAVRSRVRRLDGAAPLAAVAVCPTQFQRRVAGTDVRVHVVGDAVFATRIDSDADDYRYATRQGLPPAGLVSTELPDAVAARSRRLASALGLPVAGIDLRVTPAGEWYCFEVNPSPAFSYYESATGQPIAAAVAGLLTAALVCAAAT